jgi:hypothetical protein
MAIRSARHAATPKREVEWDGKFYKVKSDKIDIPDLQAMPRMSAILWLNAHTYPRGYSKPNPLALVGGAISFEMK